MRASMILLWLTWLALPLQHASAGQAPPDGRALFASQCAQCHDGTAETRAPAPDALKGRSAESVLAALTGGVMRYQGLSLGGAERRAVAEYVTGTRVGAGAVVDPAAGRCANTSAMRDPANGPFWNGWSTSLANTHFQPAASAGLTAAQVPGLTLKWAFGFPDVTAAWGPPTIVGGRLFVGSQNGNVYALDAKSGCMIWTFEAQAGVRTAISIGPRSGPGRGEFAAYFSDQKGYAYAVDAGTGQAIWSHLVDDHPLVRLTGSPTLYKNRLYVPTSSYEEVGKSPTYDCCTFRGAIVALDTATGAVVWRAYTIADEPKVMGKRADGGLSLGPSGGAIWSAPTIDAGRGVIYAGVGNTYSGVSQPATDAIVAFDLETGRMRWARQLAPDDVYGCRAGEANCGDKQGPDYDFGASPALTRLANGRELLIVGQKSGVGYALDPDRDGAVVWEYRAGLGGSLGGIEWGIATDAAHAYFPIADQFRPQPGGLHAVDLATGTRAWFAPPPSRLLCGEPSRRCNAAQSAAITVIPGVVFSGAFDGGIRGYSTKDGSVLWTFDTHREFATVNRVPASGGSLNGPAPVVVDGMLYVGSGDYRAMTGNVLLAFGIN
ncbi:MAG: PQQ-binding-like beta-propeller repeat protein [Acidobacteriota bacterium]|nr:PQQ-binding-like beta-propeller repeat protein [Acidobacteriota bacterium]